MTREELVRNLKRLAAMVSMGVLPCPDCECERNRKGQDCAVIKDAALEIQLMVEEIKCPKKHIHDLELSAMTPQSAVNILRNANLGGVLRVAADMGIKALEREIGGKHEAD